MSKSNDKNTRAKVGEEESVHKMVKVDQHRAATGPRLRMDISHYLAMPEYKEMRLFWATSRNGDVESWIAAGAQPVPKRGKAAKTYAGINDRQEDQYEIAHSVSVVDGVPEDNFLMFLPEEIYHDLRVAPHQTRNMEINATMGIGKADSEAVTMPGVKGLKTYAPNVGNGERGLSTRHDAGLVHDV